MAESEVLDDYPYSFFSDRRHLPFDQYKEPVKNSEWRIREKVKTVSVSLVLCLNIGVDPPDLIKTKPCAKMECWIDPLLLSGQKALEAIGRNLQSQYEAWQPRARYRLSLDPSIEETKKLCCSLRRNAKEERILFHYNGHGVPRPTLGGEIWVFNKSYTQYIPVSIYDIQSWVGSPCIFVYDCSNAGNILNAFNKFANQRDAEMSSQRNTQSIADANPLPFTPFSNCIQLAACRPNEILPMSPDLPADLFTACLTTPITIALRWFILTNPLIKNVTLDMAMKVPGRVTDRRTPLGELNWIFTSITDTIAWSILPTDLFLRLFRNDLMVAALFRNYLLADRIMRHYNCHPMSSPILPLTHQHPMWEVWDLAADQCISQLPDILEKNGEVEYKLSNFFTEQLSAFEVWIKKGGSESNPPLQLPIVLQVLLSQVHRLRALLLLSKFLDFGQWAVNLALSVGIFPYVLKLLQSPALELRPVLVFIWAKLLAVDSTCRDDLLKDNGYTYFLGILANNNPTAFLVPNISEHRAMCVFILSIFCNGFLPGQQACLSNDLLQTLVPFLQDQDSLLRQWTCVCLANFCTDFPDAKWAALNYNTHQQLCLLLNDQVPEVRAAALYGLGALFGGLDRVDEVLQYEQFIIISILKSINDASPMARKELVCALSNLIQEEETKFVYTAFELLEEEKRRTQQPDGEPLLEHLSADSRRSGMQQSIYLLVWRCIITLSVDPFPSVAAVASHIVDSIYLKVVHSNLVDSSLNQFIENKRTNYKPIMMHQSREQIVVSKKITKRTINSVSSGIFGMSLEADRAHIRRSSSFVFALKSIGNLVTRNSSGSLSGESNQKLNNLRSSAPKRRPQSLYMSSFGEASSSIGKLKNSDTEAHSDLKSEPDTQTTVKSPFFAWSCEYFMESQMQIPELDDPGSVKYSERQWRTERNAKINKEVMSVYSTSGTAPFDTFLGNVTHDLDPQCIDKKMIFHPYDPYLVVSDSTVVNVIDWETQRSLHTFANLNPSNSRITALKFINEEDSSILLVGSNEGIVRLYRNYDDPDSIKLLSAWKAADDLFPSKPGTFICEWHQMNGTLLTMGKTPIIKVWDADEEICIQDIPIDVESIPTCLHVETSGNLFLTGFENGDITLKDRRMSSGSSHYKGSNGKVLSAQFSNADGIEFMSATTEGDLLLWDIRQTTPILKIESARGPFNSFTIHNQAPLMACITEHGLLYTMSIKGRILGAIKPTLGFLNRTTLDWSGLQFHPKRLVLATSSTNSISLYQSGARPVVQEF